MSLTFNNVNEIPEPTKELPTTPSLTKDEILDLILSKCKSVSYIKKRNQSFLYFEADHMTFILNSRRYMTQETYETDVKSFGFRIVGKITEVTYNKLLSLAEDHWEEDANSYTYGSFDFIQNPKNEDEEKASQAMIKAEINRMFQNHYPVGDKNAE